LALALVAGLLVVGPRSEARVVYPPAQTLSEPGFPLSPEVAVDPQGRATVVWGDSDDLRVRAVRIAADGTAGEVQELATMASFPQVAVDPEGRATVVWESLVGVSRIQVVRMDAAGTPGPLQTLSAAGQDAFAPQIAIDPRGHASVVWRRFDGSDWRIQTVHLDADGNPGQVFTLPGAGQNSFEPQVAVDPEGFATIAWRRFDGSNWRIQVIRQNPTGGGGFPVFTLSPAGQSSFSPQVALGPEGGATVVWEQEVAPGRREIHEMRLRADFSFAGPPQRLSPSGQDARDARVARDSQGRATVVWRRRAISGQVIVGTIQSVRVGAAGPPEQIRTLSGADDSAERPRLAMGPGDRATVVWQGRDPDDWRVRAVRMGADGTPGPVRIPAPSGGETENPQVAVDPQGRPTIAWRLAVEGNFRLVQATRGAIVAPDTEVTSGPADGSTIADPTPTFTFTGSPVEEVERFECRVGAAAFAPCTSPHTIGPLADGSHTFSVRAVDAEDDADPTPAQRSFTVDTSDPDPSPSPGPSPSPSPSPDPTAHERRVGLAALPLRNRGVARGRVQTPDGTIRCHRRVGVRIQRANLRRGAFRLLRRATTNLQGAYRARVPLRPGRYRAVAPRVTFTDAQGTEHVCRRARSPIRRIPRR
jgi:hypothetical protein